MERFMLIVLISQMLSRFFSSHLFAENAFAVSPSHQPNLELTRQYLLEILAMSGLTGCLVRRLFALSTRKINFIPPPVLHRLMMRIISSRHLPMRISIQPSSLGLVSLHTRVFKYDHGYKALMSGNEGGNIFIIFSDGRRITHKMSGNITDVNMVSSDMVVVCNADNYAYVMRIANGGLILVCKLGHENDVNSACGDRSRNLFVTGSRDKSVKLWRIDAKGASECLQQLTNHNSKVTKVLIHGDDSALVIAFSDCDGRMHLLLISKDGKEVLFSVRLWAQSEGDLRIAFHPNPKKKILFSGAMNGLIIVWSFEITPSNEILTEKFVINLPNLSRYWTSSISIHPTLPIVLFCFADFDCMIRPNFTIEVVFSEDFKKVLSIMKLREGRPDGGSVRAAFSDKREVFLSEYNNPKVLNLLVIGKI